jgi:hypothetical protein
MPRPVRVLLQTTLIAAALYAPPAMAEFVNENLLIVTPKGYEVGYRDKKKDSLITEWVPVGETVDNWTEMVTVEVFYGLKVASELFMHDQEKRWRAACPGASEARLVADGIENGYPARVWFLECPRNPESGKPEITWFKALQGNDSFYVVQKASRFRPDREQIMHWVGYLRDVKVCDSRLADRACPKTKD